MALTRDFKTTINVRVQRDPTFRTALLHEAIESMIPGNVGHGQSGPAQRH